MSDIDLENADNTLIFSGTKEVAENLKFDELSFKNGLETIFHLQER